MRYVLTNGIARHAHLPDNCTLENHEHEEGKKAVVPVFIEHPQSHAEDLKDEERSGSMFGEQRAE
jgi:hypothetical protein